MVADTAAAQQTGEVQPCPDPSAHEKGNHISAAASTAALLASRSERNNNNNGSNSNARDSPLGADGKLSSRSAATSLKYAQPNQLPSFPSRGGDFNAANAAAMLAKDHKMKDLWQPEQSLAGSKAALLAHKDGGKVDLWRPSSSSAGNSAATLAMRNKGLSPQIDRGHTEAGRNNSLLAATKSHNMGRQRAGSVPVAPAARYPDAQNSEKNALNAATVSHRASVRMAPDGWNSEANQAARLKNAHLDRDLFTENPDIQLQSDIDEQRHQAALHASAASFAKALYVVQQRGEVDPETSSLHDDEAGALAAHRRNQSTTSEKDIREEALRYIHLQDAAHKLAQERLAKVDREMEPGRYREYYGYPNKSARRSRLSIRSGGGRKRASSEGQRQQSQYDSDSDDEFQARRIRNQMSQLSTATETVSDKQKQEDRARLLAAAEKRVHAQMHSMDEKVFLETGKPSQAMMDEWETKAREKAERDREQRERGPKGKTHIGGGKYMDDKEIEAIAAARLKPTLDELNDTAEKKRARDEEMRAERDRAETARMEEKMRDQQSKAEFKRIREQDKAAAKREKEERKAAERAEKEEARARKSEDKRKSREQKRDEVAAVAGGAALAEVADKVKDDQDDLSKGPSQDEPRNKEVPPRTTTETERSTEKPAQEKSAPQEKSGRGVFDRIASRLKRHGDEKKRDEEERDAKPVQSEEEKHDDGAAVAGIALVGTGAAAAGGIAAEEHHEDEKRGVDDTPVEPVSTRDVDDVETREAPERSPDHGGTWLNYRDETVHRDDPPQRDVSPQRDDIPITTSSSVPQENDREPGRVPGGFINDEDHLDDLDTDSSADEAEAEDKAGLATATAGIAALGGIVAAGAIGAERRRQSSNDDQEEVESHDSVSSLSTSDDEEGLAGERPGLYSAASAEHTGAYTFAAPATGSTARPDLERHISTIQDSSDEVDDESEDLSDSEEEQEFLGRAPPEPPVEEPVPTAAATTAATAAVVGTGGAAAYAARSETPEPEPKHVERSEETPDRDRTFVISPTPAPRREEVDRKAEPEKREEYLFKDQPVPIQDRTAEPESVSPTAVTQSEPEHEPESAPAPAVKTAPRDEELKDKDGEQREEKKGIRGFFSKLKNKSKGDHKLHKEPPPKENEKKLTKSAPSETDPKTGSTILTPVTSTSAGKEADGQHMGTDGPIGDVNKVSGVSGNGNAASASATQPQQQSAHMGTDGPIGDPKHISGLAGDPRPASPSSFKRHDNESRDLDDVSSSGAEEDDYTRGRGGRLAQRLGLSSRGKDKDRGEGGDEEKGLDIVGRQETQETTESEDRDEQFEEARDHFDESLAPPPAFAGQAKTESPNRTTRFQEQL